jgi:hypothetical protein
MRSRLLLAAAAVIAAAPPLVAKAPAPAGGKTGGPPMVLYTRPIGELLDAARGMARVVAGEQVAGMIDDRIRAKFGDAGLDGLDLTRPAGAYMYFPDKVPVEPEDWKTATGVIAVPVTSEEKFKGMLARGFGDQGPTFEPVKGEAGLYTFHGPNGPAAIPLHVRFLEGVAYFGVNVPADGMTPARLVKLDAVADPKDTALVTVRAYSDRFPEEMRKNPFKGMEAQFDKLREQAGGALPGPAESFLNAYIGMAKSYAKRMQDAEESGYHVRWDERSGEVAFETYVKPRAGTEMAKELAARKPATNQFAALVKPDAVAAVNFSFPFGPEIRPLILQGIEFGEKGVEQAPEEARPLAAEFLKGLTRTVKGDSLDFVKTVYGPDKAGKYSAVAAVTFDGADKLEQPIKDALKAAPEKAREAFKFDVAKAGGVNLHEITIPEDAAEPPAFGKVVEAFGGRTLTVAFGPKGIYAANGPDARDAIKRALEAKPAEAKAFDIRLNPKRVGELVKAIDAGAGGIVAAALGDEDSLTSAVYVAVDGGAVLTYRVGANLKLVARPFAVGAGVAR